jgi:hypothetical protein
MGTQAALHNPFSLHSQLAESSPLPGRLRSTRKKAARKHGTHNPQSRQDVAALWSCKLKYLWSLALFAAFMVTDGADKLSHRLTP